MPKLPYLVYDVTQKKTETKNFFSLQTCQVFRGFEQLSRRIVWRVMELQSGAKTTDHAGFFHFTRENMLFCFIWQNMLFCFIFTQENMLFCFIFTQENMLFCFIWNI